MRWVIWGVYVIAWTTALLTTQPVKWERLALPNWAGYPTAKGLHVSAYALMTILTGWLRAPGRWRWLLLVLVSCHGMGTEFCQQFVPERHPAWQDVGWDHLGILLGLALSWRWWWRPVG